MRQFFAVASLLAVAACTRDATLPPPPGPGTIQGRVVYAVPGQSARVAANGARLTILGTSIGAIARTDGRFLVETGALSQGNLLVQVDLDADGTPDRQKLVDLTATGARPGRDVDLGDVVVVENARIRGRVLRADVPSTTSGHAGIVVFVPEGPFTALSGDDGSYVFENLPEGRITLTFFKDGYDPAGIDGISLGAGEDFVAREVTLSPTPPPPGGGGPLAGALTGTLSLSPAGNCAAAAVTAIPVLPGANVAANATSACTFQLGSVPGGLYRVEAAMAGYVTAVVSNVMVPAGAEVRLAISLAAQGVSAPPPPPVTVPTCVAGARCDLPNPCLVGQVSCATGTPTCAALGNAIDGISCGTGHVCAGGSCVVVCVGGASCLPPSEPCKEGVVSCSTGSPACVAGSATRADGASCGTDQVCHGGVCGACVAGRACTPANGCHTGLSSCATGVETCVDTTQDVGDGTPCGTNLYCAAGICGACSPGGSCAPQGAPCHAGQVSCSTGRPACADLGTPLADGTSCGTNLVCGGGTCNTCNAGAACQPANPCRTGHVACGTGAPVCVEDALPAGAVAAGAFCGSGKICDGSGTCAACAAGAACTPANGACHSGSISCSTGAPVCNDTGALADGASCGTNQVCRAGACGTCVASASCTPLNPCDSGVTECSTGSQLCRDTGLALADGTGCGSGLYCAFGACGACQPGRSCTPPGFPCHSGTTSCATGREVCVDTAIGLQDGSACGTDLVCRSGACNTCVANAACTPANPCHGGRIACGTGLPVCVDQNTDVAAGAICGANQVCDGAGTCVACVANAACTPVNPCHAGAIGCATGAPVCGDTQVALSNGTACGTGQVCNGGSCVACVAGATCTPSNPCHFGSTSCTTGSSVCGDTAVALSDGAACGTDLVCKAGGCGACAIGAACDGAPGHAAVPASPDPCKVYGTACSSGTPACVPFSDRIDGTACPDGTGGNTYVCRAGACTAAGYAIVVALGGLGGQSLPSGSTLAPGHAYPNGSFTVKVQLVDVLGAPVLASKTIAATAPEGAVVTPASAATSAADGTATFTVRLGRAVGLQSFRFTTPTAWSPFDLSLTADAVPDGIMWPLVNATNVAASCGLANIPGPGSAAIVEGSPYFDGFAQAKSGDLYLAESAGAAVLRITSSGMVTVAAGTRCTVGYFGDGGSALTARFGTITSLALDEADAANPLLYLVDNTNNRVRVVNLATGTVDLVAGDGTAGSAAPYGDGPDARSAQLSDPVVVLVNPDRSLLVVDRGHVRIRRIAPPGGPTRAISTPVAASATCTGPLVLTSMAVNSDSVGSAALDEYGRLFLSAVFCGGSVGVSAKRIVARLDPDGTWTHVAGGGAVPSATSGIPAKAVSFNSGNRSPVVAFDRPADGGPSNLFVAIAGGDWNIGRVDAVSGTWTTVTTSKSASGVSSGEFGPISAAHLPFGGAGSVFVGRDLFVTEGQAYLGVRVLSGVGAYAASRANVALVSGNNQSIWIDEAPFQCPSPGTCLQPDNQALVVRVTDGAGAPLAGVEVRYAMAAAALPGGSIAGAAVVPTDSNGYAAGGGRAGLKAGRYDVTARVTDLHGQDVGGSPVTFTITAVEPPRGTVFTLANDSHVPGRTGIGGPASVGQVATTRGAALLGDGSLAFTSDHSVYRVDPYGILTVLAGTGTPGYSGDGGLATSATLNAPEALYFDAASNVLYVGDTVNSRIRVIDLATGFITLAAGSGVSSCTGDGGAATAAALTLHNLAIAGGWAYFSDSGCSSVRRMGVDPLDSANYGKVFKYLLNGTTAAGQTTGISCANATAVPKFCSTGPTATGSVVGDALGRIYVAGWYMGPEFNNAGSGSSQTIGIARVDPATGALVHVAGNLLGSTLADGMAIGAAKLPAYPPFLSFDAAGNLWIAIHSAVASENVVGWVAPDAVSGLIERTGVFHKVGLAAAPSVPPANDYVDSAAAYFASPYGVAVGADGKVYVTDSGSLGGYLSNSVRVIW
jgi:hypothetical protein